jgi:hypothetical protein
MDPLAGVDVTVSGLLALGGALKVFRPRPAAEALGSLGIGLGPSGHRMVPLPLMRLIGVGEVVVAVAATLFGGHLLWGAQMLCFAAFTIVATALWRRGTVSSCGCFGEVASPPSLAHVVITLAGTIISARAALVGVPGLVDASGGALAVLLTGLVALGPVYLCLVDLPRLSDALRLHRGATAA